MLCGTGLQSIYQATLPKGNTMKVLVFENIATTEQCKEYYAERFNPPYALVTPFGVDGYRASMVNRFNHKQEFMSSDIGIFASKEEAIQACLDEQALLDHLDDRESAYEQSVRDRYVFAGLGNVY
jgi:hypothetical protein